MWRKFYLYFCIVSLWEYQVGWNLTQHFEAIHRPIILNLGRMMPAMEDVQIIQRTASPPTSFQTFNLPKQRILLAPRVNQQFQPLPDYNKHYCMSDCWKRSSTCLKLWHIYLTSLWNNIFVCINQYTTFTSESGEVDLTPIVRSYDNYAWE